MNSSHAAQLRLLDLAAADTAIAQLEHRRRTLPSLATIAALDAQVDDMTIEATDLQMKVEDLKAEQARVDKDVEAVRARAARDQSRLLAGGLPSKELEGLQHEIDTLARRQGVLEDDELEVMEQLETAETALAAVQARVATLQSDRAAAVASRDADFAEIDASLSARRDERAGIAAELPADLVALYTKSGAAMLRQRRCEGCRIELSSTDVAALRAAADDYISRCDNCRRILIRTSESGL